MRISRNISAGIIVEECTGNVLVLGPVVKYFINSNISWYQTFN